jgi:hypothetical protein
MVCALCTTPQKNTHTKCTLPSPPHYRQSRPYLSRAVINRNSAVTLQDYGQFPHRYVDIFSNNHPFSIFSQINLKRGASRSPPPNHPTLLPAYLPHLRQILKVPERHPQLKYIVIFTLYSTRSCVNWAFFWYACIKAKKCISFVRVCVPTFWPRFTLHFLGDRTNY